MAWIFESNLGAWCDAVSILCGTTLTDAEWADVRRGVSSSRMGGAFSFQLGGRNGVEVSACLDDPPDIAHVHTAPSALDDKIETVTMMCRLFKIQGFARPSDDAGGVLKAP
jgi:hypothetical protein